MKRILLAIIVIGTLWISSSAQERETTMAELSPMIMKSISIQNAAPYKSVSVSEQFDKKGGKPVERSTITEEVVSRSTKRSFHEYWPDKNRPSVEYRNVGGVKYSRVGSNDWKLATGVFTVVDSAPVTGNNLDRIPFQSKQVSRVFFIGKADLDGKNATIYDVRVTVTRTYSTGEISEAFTNSRYWFADNGELVKRFTVNDDSKNGIYAETTYRFSYENLNFNIEAPILGTTKN